MTPHREPDTDARRGRSVVHALHAHLVFTPKKRRKVFNDARLIRCEQVIQKACADFGTELREFNGERPRSCATRPPPRAEQGHRRVYRASGPSGATLTGWWAGTSPADP
ncbi:transposase [Streptomyces carpinensis]|uniref:Transposase n=1 Tax=Streptomyces carpinensis TaxID=66369 RepID=A0ABV1WEX4_9ACTN|nr:transposase [Streptomyces carpinensis]